MATTPETTASSAAQSPILRAPPDARIHTFRVRVNLNRPWLEAVKAAGPDTPENHHVTTAGPLYPPTAGSAVDEDLVLLNFRFRGGSWERAIAWAAQFGLERTLHREVLAVGENCPDLPVRLKGGMMHVVATTEYGPFRGELVAYGVFWDGKRRSVDLAEPTMFGSKSTWFLFRSLRLILSRDHFPITLEA